MGLTRSRSGSSRAREHRRSGDLLPVEVLTPDGLLIRSDGAFVRYLEVVPTNPLVLDPPGCERMTRGFTELLTRVPARLSVQCYAQATPVSLDDLLACSRVETDAATAPLLASDDELKRAQGEALRKLAEIAEESLEVHADGQAAVDVRYVLVVPWHSAALDLGERKRLRARRRSGDPLTRPLLGAPPVRPRVAAARRATALGAGRARHEGLADARAGDRRPPLDPLQSWRTWPPMTTRSRCPQLRSARSRCLPIRPGAPSHQDREVNAARSTEITSARRLTEVGVASHAVGIALP